MPSSRIAEFIPRSLAEGETADDLGSMWDTLHRLRLPFHREREVARTENIGGLILCLLITPKPPKYVRAMQEYRRLFRGVSQDRSLQALFANSILPAALLADSEDLPFTPSLYFSVAAVSRLINRTSPRVPEATPLTPPTSNVLPSWF